MNVLITGASGLIGTALSVSLKRLGHDVFALERSRQTEGRFYWDPAEQMIHLDESIPIDAVIHLAGANISDGRWTAKKKKEILDSREKGTWLLANAISKRKQKPRLFISGSAIGIYGDTGDQTVDESSFPGTGFLAEVCQKWEHATTPASEAGIRTVCIRIGLVLSASGGALRKMLLPFKLGLGGVIGNGRQYMSWVSVEDIENMVRFIFENESISGAVNLVSPSPVTNHTFTKTLGKALKRPTFFTLPAFVAKIVFGEMADALLLSSSRVIPKKLETAGYDCVDYDLEHTLNRYLQTR